MSKLLAKLLKRLGIIRYDLLVRHASTFPDESTIKSGDIVHVVDGGVEKWACFRCPGGCGAVIPLNLNPNRRPRWFIGKDWFGRPTLKPSVHQLNECGCHFWVRDGQIEWCPDGRPSS